jgi:sulfite reductase (ferredoxin)
MLAGTNMAEIGFQGMSINAGKLVAQPCKFYRRRKENGNGRFSDKVIKIPSRRGPMLCD